MSKNTRNRILLTAVAALLLVVVTVAGTVAYLQDHTQEVKNTFTTTNIDIRLDETDNDDADNTGDTNEYEMVPGVELSKDPKVTVIKGSEKSWVFVKYEYIKGIDTYLDYSINTTNWTLLETNAGDKADGEKVTAVYYKIVDEIARNGQNVELSILTGDKVTVKSDVTNQQMDDAEALDLSMTFTAYAIQYEGFAPEDGDDEAEAAATAWTEAQKLGTQYDTETSTATDEGTAK